MKRLVTLLLVTCGFVNADEKPLPTPTMPAGAPKELVVFPNKIDLTGPVDEQRFVVMGVWADGKQYDLTSKASISIQRGQSASVKGNVIRPIKNGHCILFVEYPTIQPAVVPIDVTKFTTATPINFETEIQPILTKNGCNSGGCHGAALGRGGFRLSLFGFDSNFDYDQIVRSNEGRRVVVSDPERSILLSKPALVMEHGGGEKLKKGSRDYNRVLQWLADGAPAPEPAKDPQVKKLEIYPKKRIYTAGETQQLIVLAYWSDGRREDVTTLVQYDALNDSVAGVTKDGLITVKKAGETHVMLRFGGQADIASVTSPFATLKEYPKLPSNNFIDDKLIAKWKDLGLTPSDLCSDSEFLRRLYLDAIGTQPTPEEIRAFTADKSADKRNKAIDKVLDRPEFVDWWTLKWGDLLRINRAALQEKGMWSFHNWVRSQIRDGKPVDSFVREILTAEGSTFTEGPSNFFKVGANADDWTENATQVFLGVRVQCAKCHHHPFEKWSQDDYYGMSAFFARLGTKNSQEFGIFGRESVIFIKPAGEVSHPRKRIVMKPRPFDGEVMEDEFDRRKKLADWVTDPVNPFFAKNIVNRFWGYLMGHGLVEPLDDMRATNPASNPELLDALAADFVKAKFDQKHLLRMIFQSRAYQLTSNVTVGNRDDSANTHFTRFTVKRLTAEQVADALDYITGTREKYLGMPLGTRAISLPDTSYRSYLMDTFGRPSRQLTCECDRTGTPNIAQALHLLNGDFLNKKISDSKGRLEKMTASKLTGDKAIEEVYLTTICRLPTSDEVTKAKVWIKKAGNEKEGLQDLMWVLLNSREFLFNH